MKTIIITMDQRIYVGFLLVILLFFGCSSHDVKEYMQWHKVTINFTGPETSETAEVNPFLNYRLLVKFFNGNETYTVPGYYAADGNAAETSNESGNVWKVHFTPDATGEWTYKASFRKGENVAISDDTIAGEPVAFDGQSGKFHVIPSDKKKPDFRAQGRLDYVNDHYLRFAGTKEYFIKGGADSPENFLAYEDFDGTYASDKERDYIKSWDAHIKDWKDGDPVWMGNKGKGMIGALNYLASKGVNSMYFITMNIGGDGKDVWPYISHEERLRFDCSKLDQWEIVFEHMNKRGIMLHMLTQETENELLLDSGEVGLERKLYYRQLIARFAHHNALIWNLGEENGINDGNPQGQTTEQRMEMANYFKAHDPYRHATFVHTWSAHDDREKIYTPLLGAANLDGPSCQFGTIHNINSEIAYWVKESDKAGKPWVVNLDETGPASKGVMPDDAKNTNQDTIRSLALWGTLMAGGAGVEWYFGYSNPHNDLSAENFRPWAQMWDYTRHARDFFEKHLLFTEMGPANDLVIGEDNYGFIKDNEIYVFYFRSAQNAEVKLPNGSYSIEWYDPRNGGDLQGKKDLDVDATLTDLGNPPDEPDKDWVALVKAK